MTPEQRAAMLAEIDMFISLCNRAIDGDEQAKTELQVLAAANIAVMTEQARQRAWRMIRERGLGPHTPVLPLVEPRQHDWDDDPETCARYDRAHFDRDEE